MGSAATPITTFVTAFLDLREDRSKDKSFERCFDLFDQLASSGIPLHLFLSRSFEAVYKPKPNVVVEWLELEDLATYKEVVAAEAALGAPMALPIQRTPHHDTRNFMILMNAKAEFVARAAAHERWADVPQFAWIDFSICHVFRDPAASLAYLRLLAQTRLRAPVLAFPGCWYRGAHFDNLFGGINWRFCGGFFIGDRASVENFGALYRREFPLVLANIKKLTWEVNMWSYFECVAGGAWRPHWFAGDHNDSIVRVPQTLFHVVASLTTIPPRLAAGDCRKAIDSLLDQVDRVYLAVPLAYDRFPGEVELPPWLADPEGPYAEKVVVVRPSQDSGPATKYLGGLGSIPAGSWIFFCDDDQEYAGGLVTQMLGRVGQLAVYQNHCEHIRLKTSGGLVHGYVGNLAPVAVLDGLTGHPLPPAARFVDDQWMSIYCHKRSVPVLPSGVEEYRHIFAVLDGWHEKLGVASLSEMGNRDSKVAEIAAAFGVRFAARGVIEDDAAQN